MHKSQSLADSTQARANQAGEALDRIAAGVAQIEERNLVIASAPRSSPGRPRSGP